MTIEEMHIEFKVFLDKIESLQYAEFLTEEIDLILNRSMDILVENLHKANRLNELQELFQTDYSTLTTITIPNFGEKAYQYTPTFYSGSPIYLYPLNGRVHITRSMFPIIATPEYKTCDLIEYTNTDNYIVDGYNKGIFKNPKYLFYNDKIIVMLDYYSTLNSSSPHFRLAYIKKPVRMVHSTGTDCELKDDLHRKIVDLAVNLTLEEIESPRLETNTQQLQEKL